MKGLTLAALYRIQHLLDFLILCVNKQSANTSIILFKKNKIDGDGIIILIILILIKP